MLTMSVGLFSACKEDKGYKIKFKANACGFVGFNADGNIGLNIIVRSLEELESICNERYTYGSEWKKNVPDYSLRDSAKNSNYDETYFTEMALVIITLGISQEIKSLRKIEETLIIGIIERVPKGSRTGQMLLSGYGGSFIEVKKAAVVSIDKIEFVIKERKK